MAKNYKKRKRVCIRRSIMQVYIGVGRAWCTCRGRSLRSKIRRRRYEGKNGCPAGQLEADSTFSAGLGVYPTNPLKITTSSPWPSYNTLPRDHNRTSLMGQVTHLPVFGTTRHNLKYFLFNFCSYCSSLFYILFISVQLASLLINIITINIIYVPSSEIFTTSTIFNSKVLQHLKLQY